MGEPFHNHFLKNLSGWWLMIESKNHRKVPSSVLYLALSAEGAGGNVLPLEFWRTLVRSRFTISGCEIECVQRLMRRKYSDFYIFSLWGGEERYSSLPWRRNITTSNVSESEASCLTILVLVLEARRDKEKLSLATRNGSYNQRQETLPSFFSLYSL